jgi:hypothetical protein
MDSSIGVINFDGLYVGKYQLLHRKRVCLENWKFSELANDEDDSDLAQSLDRWFKRKSAQTLELVLGSDAGDKFDEPCVEPDLAALQYETGVSDPYTLDLNFEVSERYSGPDITLRYSLREIVLANVREEGMDCSHRRVALRNLQSALRSLADEMEPLLLETERHPLEEIESE